MIKVSETAKRKIINLMDEDGFNIQEHFVRVGVKSGGCSGLSYELNFDQAQQEEDKVFEDDKLSDKYKFLPIDTKYLEPNQKIQLLEKIENIEENLN